MFSMGGLLGVSQAGFKSEGISESTVWVLQGQGAGMGGSSAWPGGEGHLDSFVPHSWLQDLLPSVPSAEVIIQAFPCSHSPCKH